MSWLHRKVFDIATRVLTKPRAKYDLLLPVDLGALRRTLRKGDVILVDGEQRVSQVIKYLTQSTWSHAALYIGDELLRRKNERHAALLERWGAEAEHLIVEALMEEGVTAAPLAKYERYNLRVCRPIGLRRDDLARILDEVIGQIGHRYDVQNLFDLARYFFPVSLIPRRLRRRALGFGSGLPTQVICSSMIARAFQNVGFPILPALTPDPTPPPRRRWAALLGRMAPYPAIFHRQVETLITPRDFDLSPYFEVVKLAPVEHARFDYRRIRWA
jgi:hypothetical protein